MLFFGSSGVKFDAVKDIPSLKGKVILVTGGNSGLGRQSVLDLSRHEAEVWLAARDAAKAQEAIDSILKEVPDANIKALDLDLTSFDSIKKAARTFSSASQRLDVLMLNAGIMGAGPGLTKDGYELQFGTNHMGHALLTKLLTPVLERTAASQGGDVRVVVLTSMGVTLAPKGGILFDTLKTKAEKMGSLARYGQSKLANALFAAQLAKQHPQFTVTSLHPGVVSTNILHYSEKTYWYTAWLFPIVKMLSTTVEDGAKNQLWAATAPKKDIVSGKMYLPVGITDGNVGPYVEDAALAKKLWDWTEEELKEQTL